MINFLFDLWDDLPPSGRLAVFGIIPAELLFLAVLALWAVAS